MSHPHNPIDTPEQRAHERLALDYYHHHEIEAARREVRDYWLDLAKPGDVMRSCFDAAFEEVMFGAVVWALNQDPLYPKVVTITRLPHTLDGVNIPGSRWGIDNPDSVYRVIPISGEERYLIRGRVGARRLVENYFTLWSPVMQTVGLLSGHELVVDEQGYFEITVDSSPSEGRSNHIQSGPEAHEFYIRDVIFDWAQDRANELSIERLGDTPSRPPFSEREQLDRIKDYMHKWATNTTRWNRQALDRPVNEFDFVIDRESDGALRGQIYIMGHFALPDTHSAIVLDVDMGGADYFIAPITNIWGTSNEIVHRNGSLNKHQAVANDDGSYTFVVSLQDPGVHNWLDPTDMPEGILTLRWAEFEGGAPGASFGVKSRLTTLAQLQQSLPSGCRKVSPQQRRQQLDERASSYAWRIAGEAGR
ncbi:MAG: hypothetical protein KDI17_06825 [Halioglobus sp.]|nr:hypothetical protein [Halioglobus sp.]